MRVTNGKTFGNLVREYRQKNCLRLREVAKFWGITVGYLSDIESGRRPPTPQLIEIFESYSGSHVPIEFRVQIMMKPTSVHQTLKLFPEIEQKLHDAIVDRWVECKRGEIDERRD